MKYKGVVFFGGMGSGKDSVAELVHESFVTRGMYVVSYNIGNLCREIAKVSDVDDSWVGSERKLKQLIADKLREVDVNIFNKYVLAKIVENGDKFSMVTGGRTRDDVVFWRERGFFIVGVDVDEDEALRRVLVRDGAVCKEDKNHSTEKDVRYIVENLCDMVLDNNGSYDDLIFRVEDVVGNLM